MDNEFKIILTSLERLNNHTSRKIITPNDFAEEKTYIQDLNWLDKNTTDLIKRFKKTSYSNAQKKSEQLCSLYPSTNSYIAHIERLRDLTEKFIGLYREKASLRKFDE